MHTRGMVTPMETFTVQAERDSSTGSWAVWCEEAGCYSQVTHLSDAAEELRDAISYMTGLDPNAFRIVVSPISRDSDCEEPRA